MGRYYPIPALDPSTSVDSKSLLISTITKYAHWGKNLRRIQSFWTLAVAVRHVPLVCVSHTGQELIFVGPEISRNRCEESWARWMEGEEYSRS